MHITIISSSQRANSQTLKVCNYLQEVLKNKNVETSIFNLFEENLPFFNTDKKMEINWLKIKEIISNSDGLILATPEWNGSASPMLLNFLEYCSVNEVAHKPTLLVSVSAGRGGANPILQMRQSAYKNNRILYIPEHLIVRKVESVLNPENSEIITDEKADEIIKTRANYAVDILLAYAESLKNMRVKTDFKFADFKNGMS
jgi:multimeric flavodoxin WrbA